VGSTSHGPASQHPASPRKSCESSPEWEDEPQENPKVNVATPAPAARPASSTGRVRTKEYETIYILRSDVDAESAERIQARVAEAVEREHGKLVKVEGWGRRRLAYPIGKLRRGVYVYLKYVGGGGLVAEVERNLKLQEAVVKYMTVLTNDEVDLAALQIDPEETKLGKFELPPEPEVEESREKQLGLVDLGPDAPRSMRRDEPDEFPEEAEGDIDAHAADRKVEAAPAAVVPAAGGIGTGGAGGEES
jgi:small subunit ribosomal protein S6